MSGSPANTNTETAGGGSSSRWRGEARGAATVGAVLAVLLTSTSIARLFSDTGWLPPAVFTAAAVAGAGAAARALHAWRPLIVPVQLAVLVTALAMLFSGQAILGVLPGPAAVGELLTLLGRSFETVRNGVPPVASNAALRCLVCLCVGLVAIVVDAVAVSAAAPAVAGLVLLCVFAVPASLADAMLPWWSFLAGAAGFVLLLVTGGSGEERSPGFPARGFTAAKAAFGRQSLAVGGMAVVFALLVGTVFTGVGTEGRIPGARSDSGTETGGIGLRPFTSLRGQLQRDDPVELFRVEGLPDDAYLRAMTLREFDPDSGWKLAGLTAGVRAQGRLPLPVGMQQPVEQRVRIRIEPLGYRDAWLPVFGVPLRVSGMGDNWRYDPVSGMVFTRVRQKSQPYVEIATFPEPTASELRNADGPMRVSRTYLEIEGVSQRVIDLAERITAGEPTDFDKAVALNRFFTGPSSEFTYDLQTAPPSSGRALEDFLFRGKRGYCEQFASAMAVLLRAVGIPSRVAVGFTAGSIEGSARVITTDDAHAWVEAYFPGHGWVTFDPTPLRDGRTELPSYLSDGSAPAQQPTAQATPRTTEPSRSPETGDRSGDNLIPPPPGRPGPTNHVELWAIAGVTVLVLALLAGPAVLRSLRRRKRLGVVAAGHHGAADSAWQELLDACRDRGSGPAAAETVRKAAANLVEVHGLDEEGARAVRMLARHVERDWYAPAGQPSDAALSELVEQVLESMHRSAPLNWWHRLFPRSVLRPGGPRPVE